MENSLTPNPQTTPTATPPPTPPTVQPPVQISKKTNLLPILLAAAVSAGVFGFGGYYFGKQSLSSNQTSDLVQSPSPTPIATVTPTTLPSPSAATQPTANWKTYNNTDPKYSIKYPADWAIDTSKAKPDPEMGAELTLSKGSYKVTIFWPSAYGPSGCIFEDQKDLLTPELGPVIELCEGDFKEFKGVTNTFRRFVSPRTDTQTSVWNVYTQGKGSRIFVTVPPISYNAPKNYDPKEIEVMDTILTTFKQE